MILNAQHLRSAPAELPWPVAQPQVMSWRSRPSGPERRPAPNAASQPDPLVLAAAAAVTALVVALPGIALIAGGAPAALSGASMAAPVEAFALAAPAVKPDLAIVWGESDPIVWGEPDPIVWGEPNPLVAAAAASAASVVSASAPASPRRWTAQQAPIPRPGRARGFGGGLVASINSR